MSETESGFLGSMREDAELLDAIVEDAMRRRRLQAWRPRPEDFAALEAIAEETRGQAETIRRILAGADGPDR